MNLYIVVEGGKATRSIYKNWIPYVNEDLVYVDYLDQLQENNFYILAGKGQPQIFTDGIRDAIQDVNNIEKIDRLVIAVDSENFMLHEKREELDIYIASIPCRENVEVKVIIQHFCLETWLLGNMHVFRRQPSSQRLQNYMKIFNIRQNDPELLPSYEQENLNRSQFAYKYLKEGMKDTNFNTNRKINYSKRHPGNVIRESYFRHIRDRFDTKKHIQSFDMFLEAFK